MGATGADFKVRSHRTHASGKCLKALLTISQSIIAEGELLRSQNLWMLPRPWQSSASMVAAFRSSSGRRKPGHLVIRGSYFSDDRQQDFCITSFPEATLYSAKGTRIDCTA